MSMLADRRQKVRYSAGAVMLRQAKNDWTEDTSKFGHRMLEKMGWAPGKGLGAKESGSVDPVHVKFKSDVKGLGFQGPSEDIAVAQQQDFEALLASLSQQTDGANQEPVSADNGTGIYKSPKSLELLSQKSRARVHYYKFTRGKDLSRASSQDLKSILGMSMSKQAPAPVEPEVVPDVGPKITSNMLTPGLTTIERGTMSDYFKQKYQERKRKMGLTESEDDTEKKTESENVDCSNPFTSAGEVNKGTAEPERKKKKKKMKTKDNDAENNDSMVCNSSILNTTVNDENCPSSSKGRRKSVTWGDVEVSFVTKYIKDMVDTSSDSISDDFADVMANCSDVCETTEVDGEKKKKKKKRKKIEDLPVSDESSTGSVSNDTTTEVSPTRTDSESFGKKKKKHRDLADEENHHHSNQDGVIVNGCSEGTEDCPEDGTFSKKKKKKKKNSESELVSDVYTTTEVHSDPLSETCDSTKKQKKKSKGKSETFEEVVNTDCANDFVDNDGNDLKSISKKEKKKKKKIKLDCTNVLEEKVDELREKFSSEGMSESESKKKRKRSEETFVCDQDVELSNQYSPEKKKRKKKEKSVIEPTIGNQSAGQIEEQPTGSSEVTAVSKDKKKKKKRKEENGEILSLENHRESKTSLGDVNINPKLSSLTQERMAKWKERKASKKDEVARKGLNSKSGGTNIKVPSAKIRYNSNVPIQDYNHRRVLAVLGCSVKEQAEGKIITVNMPSTNFTGSNLDSLPGYGQAVTSC